MTASRSSLDKLLDRSVAVAGGPAERVDFLDGWRGIAILCVLVEHFCDIEPMDEGRLGVDIFFVLSGMLIANILFVKRTPLGLFYKRRVTRIIPVFVLFVAVVFGVGAAVGTDFGVLELLATMGFLRTYYPPETLIWNSPLPIGHLWSLNVEEHAYVLMSLLTLLLRSPRAAGLALLALGFTAQGMHLFYAYAPDLRPFDYELRTETAIAFILLSAGYSLVKAPFARRVPSWVSPLALLLAAACYTDLAPWRAKFLTPALLALAVNHLGQMPALLRRALAWGPLRFFGICSYSIYLWQQPVYKLQAYLPYGTAALIAILAGVASFYLFENPMRGLLNRVWKAQPPR